MCFLAEHPALQIELDLSDRLRPLAQEGFDLAIRHTSTPPDTHVAWMLRETRTLLLASPAYLARAGRPASPDCPGAAPPRCTVPARRHSGAVQGTGPSSA